MTALSAHFDEREFDCASGEPVPIVHLPNLRYLVTAVIEPLRMRWGHPLIVIAGGGYRSPAYNEAIRKVSDERARREGRAHGGVAKFSQHLTASAADIRPVEQAALPVLCSMVESMLVAGELPALGGWGKYPGWIHLDIRPATPGHPVRWLGEGVGSEPP